MHSGLDRYQSRDSLRIGHIYRQNDHITTRARQGALTPPLALSILLRRKNDASCDLQGRRGARH